MRLQPELFHNATALADAVIQRVGKRIVLGLPLGLGKANLLANALFARAQADPTISLTIFTALTLEAPPQGNSDSLTERFIGPLREKFFAGYPRLAYIEALCANVLPANVQVKEFFLQPGQWLNQKKVQQNYISLNYTQALNVLLDAGINVVGQLLAAPLHSTPDRIAERYSLSCNPDITADLLDLRRSGKLDCLIVGEVNRRLPYMYGAADRSSDDFDLILDRGLRGFPLFMPPHQPVNAVDHAIGLHVARLIPDGGTLQIGIGSIGDAIANALILRHRHEELFRQCVVNLSHATLTPVTYSEPFNQGLYGLSEMLVEGFLELMNAGIIKREVDGYLVHSSFFMGSPLFYKTLARMSKETRNKIAMMPVSFVNQLYGDEPQKRSARVGARFINSGIIATLLGDVVSDGLADGQVISGVGGQHDFVTQAFALQDARSIITIRATRSRKGKVESNIRFSYEHTTIPRHLRDIVVSEYGIADLRGKSDAEVIAAMLNITDSRFQDALLQEAKSSGKISATYKIPVHYRDNTPAKITRALAGAYAAGKLPVFPLGSDLNPEEQRLAVALKSLEESSGSIFSMLKLLRQGLRKAPPTNINACLERMKLNKTESIKSVFFRYLLIGALIDSER